MLTKTNKKEIKTAEKELEKNRVKMKKLSKKRITKLVRVGIRTHSILKEVSKDRKVTISKLVDEIVRESDYGRR